MTNVPATSNSRRTSQDILQEILSGLQHLDLSDSVDLGQVVAMGGFADVYDGTMLKKNTDQRVKIAAKKIRCMLEKEEEFAKSFRREFCIWARLQHENILPLIGIAVIDGAPVLVSEWMENGTMNKYLKEQKGVDILAMVQGLARGLEYLHDVGVVHSDLRGDNVLIAHDGRPVLSDFGVSRLLVNSMTIAGTSSLKGVMRWMAPELFGSDEEITPELIGPDEEIMPEHSLHTKATDVWAFGMVVYEALTGKVPFYTSHNDGQVIRSIMSRNRPSKARGERIDGKRFEWLWECCDACWNYEPAGRPKMAGVRELIERTFCIETISKISKRWGWMSPTGRFLALRSYDRRSISFFDSKTANRCGPDLQMDSRIYGFAWSSTEDRVVTSSEDGILHRWSNILEAPLPVTQSSQKHEYAYFEFSPDDRFISSFRNEARLWDASNLSLVWEYAGVWWHVAFHPLGNRIVIYQWDSLLDVNTEDPGNIKATERKSNHDVCKLILDPSGNTCVARIGESVKILSADTFEEKSSLPYDDCAAIQITPNGKYILLVLWSKRVVLWSIAAEETLEELSLDVDEFDVAEISRGCHALCFGMGHSEQYIHLATTYY